jgi:hypothetical protein
MGSTITVGASVELKGLELTQLWHFHTWKPYLDHRKALLRLFLFQLDIQLKKSHALVDRLCE